MNFTRLPLLPALALLLSPLAEQAATAYDFHLLGFCGCSSCASLTGGTTAVESDITADPFRYLPAPENRWTSSATTTLASAQGDPLTLTWGFALDGTTIVGKGVDSENAADPNILIASLNAQFGAPTTPGDLTTAPWFNSFASSYNRWADLSGLTFIYEPNDDGASMGGVFASGTLGVRADMRIGGRNLDGPSNVLAYNYSPASGDMVIDTSDIPGVFSNNLAFRNMIMHEAGHGLGFAHLESNNSNHLMEPFLSTAFDGPQLDDILAVQRNYGDALEKNGGNDTVATATSLGALTSTLSIGTLGDSTVVLPTQTDFISIDGASDIDFFSFSVSSAGTLGVTLTPRGTTYNEGPQNGTQTAFNTKALANLMFNIFGTDGTTLLGTASGNAAGLNESISGLALNSSGTYFIRVAQEAGSPDNIQLYGLDLSFSPLATGGNFWDSNGAAAGSDNSGGSWSEAKWSADPAGAVATGNFVDGSTPTFSAGTNATGTFTVSVNQSANVAGLTFQEGTVTLANGGGTLTLTSPAIAVATGLTATIAAPLAGAAGLQKTGDGILVLSAANTYSGGTTIDGGTLRILTDSALGAVPGSFSANNITLNNNARLKNHDGSISLDANRGITLGSGGGTIEVRGLTNITVNGVISGTGALTKIDGGTLILAATNTYSGITTISQGTLQIGNGGTTGSITGNITNNAALIFNRSDNIDYSGQISGSGTLTKNGAGILRLLNTSNTYTGTNTVNNGTLRILADGSLGAAPAAFTANHITLNNNARLKNDVGSISLHANRGITLGSGGGTIEVRGGTDITVNGAISGSSALTKIDTGTLILAATNTYSGGTTITTGTLQIGNGGTTGSVTGNITNNAALVFNRSNNLTFAGNITGNGTLAKQGAGTLTLTGNKSGTGTSTISAGTLRIGDGGTSGTFAGNITIQPTAVLIFDRSDTTSYSGNITGGGDLTKQGAGTLTLTGNSPLTGNLSVLAGTLTVDGILGAASSATNVAPGATLNGSGTVNGTMAVTSGGTLTGTPTIGGNLSLAAGSAIAPGNSPGTITVNGNYSSTSTTAFDFEAGQPGVVGGANNDLVLVTGSGRIVNFDAALTVRAPDLGTFGGAGRYTILDAPLDATINNTFINDASRFVSVPDGFAYRVSTDTSLRDIVLDVASFAAPQLSTLTIDFGILSASASANSTFSLTNSANANFSLGLDVLSITETDPSGLFSIDEAALLAIAGLLGGQSTAPFSANFLGSSAFGTYSATYLINFANSSTGSFNGLSSSDFYLGGGTIAPLTLTLTASVIPEPSRALLLLLGLAHLLTARRRPRPASHR